MKSFGGDNRDPRVIFQIEQFSTELAEFDKEMLFRRQILSLLYFDEIHERHDAIKERYDQTFEWAFQESRVLSQDSPAPEDAGAQTPTPQWDSFEDWLKGGKDLYWITGKPGSGKSTLMKFLYHDERAMESALEWSGDQELITAGFFFWNSGAAMQKSRMGMAQTLLRQCLSEHEGLIQDIFKDRYERYAVFGGNKQPLTWNELTTAFKKLLLNKHFRFLIFIDGLDEFDSEFNELVAWLSDLRRVSPDTVKFCVASRPELTFEEAFQSGPNLRMHDLTQSDIQLYVTEHFEKSPRWEGIQSLYPEDAIDIVHQISDMANGVFLWVTIVVASLLNGLRDGDVPQDLRQRIDQLPQDLEDLFKKILGDLTPEYLSESCEMFKLATAASKPLSVLRMLFATEGYEKALEAPLHAWSKEELAFQADTMRRRIMSRCKGLLEVQLYSVHGHEAPVQFLHRTVKDFFQKEEIAEHIRLNASKHDSILLIAVSYLRELKMTPRHYSVGLWDDFWFPIKISMDDICDEAGDEILIRFVDEIEKVGCEFWSQPGLGSKSPKTLLEEALDRTQDDCDNRNQANARQISQVLNGRYPHWTATNLFFSNGYKHGKADSMEDLQLLTSSFLNIAVESRLNFYVQARLTPQMLQVGGQRYRGLLPHALLGDNDSIFPFLLKTGANPNWPWEIASSSKPLSFWARFLEERSPRRTPDLFMLLIDHGADLTILSMDQITDIVDYLKQEDKDRILKKWKAANSTSAKLLKGSATFLSVARRKVEQKTRSMLGSK